MGCFRCYPSIHSVSKSLEAMRYVIASRIFNTFLLESIKIADPLMKFVYKKKLKIHNGWINKVVFSPNNDLIATCSTDSTIKILKNDVLLKTIKSHKLNVTSIVFSDKYPILASGSSDRKVLCHDLVTMKIFRSFYGSYTGVQCIDIDHNMVVAGDRNNIQQYDLRTSKIVETYNIGQVVNDVKIASDKIYAGCHSFYIIDRNKNCTAFCVNQNEIKEVKKTPDGVLILSKERIIDLQIDCTEQLRYTEIKSCDANFNCCESVEKTKYCVLDDKILLCNDFDNNMIDNNNTQLLAVLDDRLNCISVSKNQDMIVTCRENLHCLYRRKQ